MSDLTLQIHITINHQYCTILSLDEEKTSGFIGSTFDYFVGFDEWQYCPITTRRGGDPAADLGIPWLAVDLFHNNNEIKIKIKHTYITTDLLLQHLL